MEDAGSLDFSACADISSVEIGIGCYAFADDSRVSEISRGKLDDVSSLLTTNAANFVYALFQVCLLFNGASLLESLFYSEI